MLRLLVQYLEYRFSDKNLPRPEPREGEAIELLSSWSF